MDVNGDGTLTMSEFSQACKDFRINMTVDDAKFLFNQFDQNKDGRLNYDEFLRGVRGEMSDSRREIVRKAFSILDTNQNGQIEIADIAGTYSAEKHPAVVEGRKTEDQVLAEFLETFETHHNLGGGQNNSIVTPAEFEEYYNNVSASIDDDKYFAVMMDGAWNISGHAAQYQKQENGWTNQSPGPQSYSYKNADPYADEGVAVQKTLRHGLESSDNPWATTETYYNRGSPMKGRQISNPKYDREERNQAQITGQQSHGSELAKGVVDTFDDFLGQKGRPLTQDQAPADLAQKRDLELKLEKFRKAVLATGFQGFIRLLSDFKRLDKNRNNTLEFSEFADCLFNSHIQEQFSDSDLQFLFRSFDLNNDGHINFAELMTATAGELTQFRSDRIELAWRRINATQAATVPLTDVFRHFNASRHPAVKQGETNEDTIVRDFQGTFNAHHEIYNSFSDTQGVSKGEFLNFYRMFSATVPIDAAFNQYMVGVWNIDVKDLVQGANSVAGKTPHDHEFSNHRGAWKYDFHRSLYGDKDEKTFEHPGDGINSRPRTAVSNEMPAAGVSNFISSRAVTKSNVSCLGEPKLPARVQEDDVLDKLRRSILSRGARGIVGLRRSFSIVDDDGSRQLNWEQFWKALNDFRIKLDESEGRELFSRFDANRNGAVDFDEFLRTLTGQMNEIRKELVRGAFKKFDADGSGKVDVADLKSYYNAKQHPDVLAGTRTEEDALMEFLDTFDTYHRVRYGGQAGKPVTLEEFIEYTNISTSIGIPDDEDFENHINQVWNLKNRNYSRGWAGY